MSRNLNKLNDDEEETIEIWENEGGTCLECTDPSSTPIQGKTAVRRIDGFGYVKPTKEYEHSVLYR